MTDLMQRARDIAAEHRQAECFRNENYDPENTQVYIQFMRDGAYDDDALVQAVFAGLREGMALAQQVPA